MEHLTTDEKIGRIIRSLRLNDNLTQKQLADELNIHEKHLSKIERGRKSITIALLDKLAEYFKKPHIYFFEFSNVELNSEDIPEISLLKSLDEDMRRKLIEVIKVFIRNK